ncbi:MAG: 2-succinyl-5-enolpyruvyl-6-hydroxy-3-cyclohexene-1-carboxylate synthase [Chlamydiia bacterium]|nr:2-succinyl-5-enolpyruvyl-6-hydroxy-3-cyclohexene-1-carboxylate synthase [Chlamydiia bacterium]
MNNNRWSNLIVKQLVQHGVRHFCIAPGSQSTGLVLAVADHPLTIKHVHFDERGLGYFALGIARAQNEPVAIITTSGSAVANLLPAIIEADKGHIPLLILSADRNISLHDCGANQTIDQLSMLTPYVRHQRTLPSVAEEQRDEFVAAAISEAIFQATNQDRGPVHLNIPYKKPLFDESVPHLVDDLPIHMSIQANKPTFDPQQIQSLQERFSGVEKGMILVGEMQELEELEEIFQLAMTLGWPIVSDIHSNLRSLGTSSYHIRYALDALMQGVLGKEYIPDVVLHLGGRIVASPYLQWLKTEEVSTYYHVDKYRESVNPFMLVTHRVLLDPIEFCRLLRQDLPLRSESVFLAKWQELSLNMTERVENFLGRHNQLTEPYLAYMVANQFPEIHHLFLGNSMPVRDMDRLFYPDRPCGKVFGNRGHSGIDGNIATAIGIATALQEPLLAILGDMTCLHDLNSFALLAKSKLPITFVIINNQGGTIFNFLPIAKQSSALGPYFRSDHVFTFEKVAEMFGIDYARVDTPEGVLEELGNQKIIELSLSHDENVDFHEKLQKGLAKSRRKVLAYRL